jgi:hypothetical protein
VSTTAPLPIPLSYSSGSCAAAIPLPNAIHPQVAGTGATTAAWKTGHTPDQRSVAKTVFTIDLAGVFARDRA